MTDEKIRRHFNRMPVLINGPLILPRGVKAPCNLGAARGLEWIEFTGAKIKLQKQPSDLLRMLLERPGEVVTLSQFPGLRIQLEGSNRNIRGDGKRSFMAPAAGRFRV